MKRFSLLLLLGGFALATATLAQSQFGGSPPPNGLTEGEGAGFPKGNYASLDTLPDWGGVWFLNRGGASHRR